MNPQPPRSPGLDASYRELMDELTSDPGEEATPGQRCGNCGWWDKVQRSEPERRCLWADGHQHNPADDVVTKASDGVGCPTWKPAIEKAPEP